MTISRRQFLQTSAVLAASSRTLFAQSGLKLGVTDWNLRQTGRISAVELAASIGFQGVEVSLGQKPVDGKLPLDNADIQAQYLAAAKQHNIALAGTCLDILHVNYLKNDKLALKWIADGIPITQRLNARVMLLPMFNEKGGALNTQAEKDYVGDALREVAPAAEKAGVILGLENTVSAEDNVRIMERSRSSAVLVYYDVGNSTRNGHNVIPEIRWLGATRIGQFHLKDLGYLGEGKIDFAGILAAIKDIGFTGFGNLETSTPSKTDVAGDMRRNLAYLRKLMT
jgi:sugar phosphate isomerase/epimerase